MSEVSEVPKESTQNRQTAPAYSLLLPVAYILHLLEEWFGGFSNWTQEVLGQEISEDRFILINTIFFIITLVGTLASMRFHRLAWVIIALAALFGLNGILHNLASLAFAQYSPGTVTGLLVYVPLSLYLLKTMRARIPRAVFNGSLLLGIMLHGFIFFLARI